MADILGKKLLWYAVDITPEYQLIMTGVHNESKWYCEKTKATAVGTTCHYWLLGNMMI